MSENKFTPGPWLVTGGTFVYALNDYGTNSFWANIYAGSQGGYKSAATSSEEIEANANLIAAAPDLLEALERIMDLGIVEHQVGWPELELALSMSRVAISKARGES